ncbi:MAG: DUF4845 domain-containing protein [Gammaproteobacteria bacterium]|nr:DUF4845 domain-containing protein [Gammaproteobacteria bacterium]
MANGFKGPHRQRGVSKLGLLIMGIFVALFLTVGLKVGPLYMDNNVLTSLADDLVADGTANRLELTELRQRFADALRLNSIYDFELEDVEFRRGGGRTIINIAYERRLPLFANLDIVAVFDHTAQ